MAPAINPVASQKSRRYTAKLAGEASNPIVDPCHLAAGQATAAFHVGQEVDVQLRMYIWVAGTVTTVAYQPYYSSIIYEVQYVAADGGRRRECFFPNHVRKRE